MLIRTAAVNRRCERHTSLKAKLRKRSAAARMNAGKRNYPYLHHLKETVHFIYLFILEGGGVAEGRQ